MHLKLTLLLTLSSYVFSNTFNGSHVSVHQVQQRFADCYCIDTFSNTSISVSDIFDASGQPLTTIPPLISTPSTTTTTASSLQCIWACPLCSMINGTHSTCPLTPEGKIACGLSTMTCTTCNDYNATTTVCLSDGDRLCC